jgi:hypothetical protein
MELKPTLTCLSDDDFKYFESTRIFWDLNLIEEVHEINAIKNDLTEFDGHNNMELVEFDGHNNSMELFEFNGHNNMELLEFEGHKNNNMELLEFDGHNNMELLEFEGHKNNNMELVEFDGHNNMELLEFDGHNDMGLVEFDGHNNIELVEFDGHNNNDIQLVEYEGHNYNNFNIEEEEKENNFINNRKGKAKKCALKEIPTSPPQEQPKLFMVVNALLFSTEPRVSQKEIVIFIAKNYNVEQNIYEVRVYF